MDSMVHKSGRFQSWSVLRREYFLAILMVAFAVGLAVSALMFVIGWPPSVHPLSIVLVLFAASVLLSDCYVPSGSDIGEALSRSLEERFKAVSGLMPGVAFLANFLPLLHYGNKVIHGSNPGDETAVLQQFALGLLLSIGVPTATALLLWLVVDASHIRRWLRVRPSHARK